MTSALASSHALFPPRAARFDHLRLLSSALHRHTSPSPPPPPPTSPPPTSSQQQQQQQQQEQPLYHRQLRVRLRREGARACRRVRKDGLIPSCIRGRGQFEDLLIKVDTKPLQQDYTSSLFCHQQRGRWLLQTPLYQLLVSDEDEDDDDKILYRMRVLGNNVLMHFVRPRPVSIDFVYAPEHLPVRLRIPVRPLNQEKSPGLKAGGWLNRLRSNIEVRVDPFVTPPLFAQVDVADLALRQHLSISHLVFPGIHQGVTPLLPSHTPIITVSKH